MTSDTVMTLPDQSADWVLPSHRKIAMACLLVTEASLFTIFVVAYLFYLDKSVTGPLPAAVLTTPILATVCLLSSSLTIILAERAFRRRRTRTFQLWWLATIVLALAFLSSTAVEWHDLIAINHLTISTNLFGSTFYSLVGLHASHVVIGLILLGLVFVWSLSGPVAATHAEHLEMISWYWHFVDAVWVVVFTIVYILGR
ncbi:MAG: heme-copper oxidase subunit III [Candidatus Binatia bacterium]